MIRVVKIDKYFNRFRKNKIHVINNTSFDLPSTGLVALLGPSGSGKTTLLNVIGGLDKVRKGQIYVNGKKITSRFQWQIDKIRNLNIGYIFQDYKLIEDKSVYENVAISLKLIGIRDKKEIDKRVCYILDKVGMLRFKKRPCNMLSGGERQRVGIARAIVKNPNIIIADEPTGNLDSKNSIEIMNIIKAISKEKLVILVTHEKDLARFYATRIMEIEDGVIVKDYENETPDELDYNIINNLYLKDFENREDLGDIHIYSNKAERLDLNIVVINNNIYIETKTNKKIEVIDEDSSIQMIDDHYKNISKQDVEKYNFNYQNIINEPKKIKYSSIFNPITFITNGFKKVLDYSFMKKILLIGFFLSGIFVTYALSSMKATLIVKDEKFININKNYLLIDSKKIKVEDYHKLEQEENIDYILPTNSLTTLKLKADDYYQFVILNAQITGSITNLEKVSKDDVIIGRYPENDREILVDKMVLSKRVKEESSKMMGLTKIEQYNNRIVLMNPVGEYKIVGITDTGSPSIYVPRTQMITILYHAKNNKADEFIDDYYIGEVTQNKFDDYHYYMNEMELKEGRWPENDYETILNISQKEVHKLDKEIDVKINDRKLVVVGYYSSKKRYDTYFVNAPTMKTYFIKTSSNIAVYPKDKQKVIEKVTNEYHMAIKDSYQTSREKYMKQNRKRLHSAFIAAAIVLGISLIEILLMIRSSFLSRVKEVGIYRAIGVKKKDIYIMFSGEIFAITTFASIPGIVLSAYIIEILSKVDFLQDYIVMSFDIVLVGILLVYIFNLIVGLIPVFVTMRKRPAEILVRTDI